MGLKTEAPKAKIGAPSKYREEYCQVLIDSMTRGLSYEAVAGILKVSVDTLFDWEKVHPVFLQSKKKGVALSQLFWEEKLIEAVNSPKGINVIPILFILKCRFGYRDKDPGDQGDSFRPIIIKMPQSQSVLKIDKEKAS